MVSWKDFIKKQFLNKKVRFIADCIIPIDVSGFVSDIEWHNGETIFYVTMDNGKISKVGSNTNDLRFEFL